MNYRKAIACVLLVAPGCFLLRGQDLPLPPPQGQAQTQTQGSASEPSYPQLKPNPLVAL